MPDYGVKTRSISVRESLKKDRKLVDLCLETIKSISLEGGHYED